MPLDRAFAERAKRRGLRSISERYGIGWDVAIKSEPDRDTQVRFQRAAEIIGIPHSKTPQGKTPYPVETYVGPKGDGDGGLLWHPSIYWETRNPIANLQRKRRHAKALAEFRNAHGGSAQHISSRGVAFIAGFEGAAANWYSDPVGVATIGFGHTGPLPRGFSPPLSHQRQLDLLALDLVRYENGVKQRIKVPMAQPVLDGLTSFAYNLGPGALDDGIAAAVNQGNLSRAVGLLQQYDHAGGQRLPGLTRRRQAEAKMILQGRY